MAEHVWSVLCERSSIDKDTNQVSLFNVIENLHMALEPTDIEKVRSESAESGRPPLFRHEMHLVSWWVRSNADKPETVQIRITSRSPAGDLGTAPVTGYLDLVKFKSYRMRVEIGGIAYKGDGRYWMEVEKKEGPDLEWETVTRLPFVFSLVELQKVEKEEAASES